MPQPIRKKLEHLVLRLISLNVRSQNSNSILKYSYSIATVQQFKLPAVSYYIWVLIFKSSMFVLFRKSINVKITLVNLMVFILLNHAAGLYKPIL